jgi:2'-5' RNA ligase
MKKYEGGCAIMLNALSMDDEGGKAAAAHVSAMNTAAARWSHPYLVEQDLHLTLQFIGRDLESRKAASVIVSAFVFADESGPIRLRFTGAFDVFRTRKGTYLVALVETTEHLLKAREGLAACLAEMGVTPKDPFDFKPHVTLVPGHPKAQVSAPEAIEPFEVSCRELVVKYGKYRMIVEL